MFTVSDILQNIDRGCLANNMIEDSFSYRIIFYVNDGNKSGKHYMDTRYDGLRTTLENIIRRNLTTTNTVVLAAVTARKNGETVSLLSRPYSFNLNGYFEQIAGKKGKGYKTVSYGRRKAEC